MDVNSLFGNQFGVVAVPCEEVFSAEPDGATVNLPTTSSDGSQWITDASGPVLVTFSTINSIPLDKQDDSTTFLPFVPSVFLSDGSLLGTTVDGSPQTLTFLEPSDSPQTVISVDSLALASHQTVESILETNNADSSPMPLLTDDETFKGDLLEGYSLEDFVDVLTVFKCKLCHYHCESKEELGSHLTESHNGGALRFMEQPMISGRVAEQDESSSVPLEIQTERGTKRSKGAGKSKKTKKTVSEDSDPKVDSTSNVFFSCGSCHEVCTTLGGLRTHMIAVHRVKKEVELDDSADDDVRALESKTGAVEIELSESDVIGSIATEKVGGGELSVVHAESNLPERAPTTLRDPAQLDLKFPCSMCRARFSSMVNLEKHCKCHRPAGSGSRFKCIVCRRTYDRWPFCAGHLWLVHRIAIDLYACRICDYKTAHRDHLTSHGKRHDAKKEFCCRYCPKLFNQKTQLRNHEVHHMKKNADAKLPEWAKPKECIQCHRTFSDSKALKAHIKTVHWKLKPYICQVCGHCSARKGMFKVHIRQHTGDKPFSCQDCDFSTRDHNSLRRHIMRHTGAKQYQCKFCSYSAIQSHLFKLHLMKKHGGEGVFLCSLCSYTTLDGQKFLYHNHDEQEEARADKESEDTPTLIYVPYSEKDNPNKNGAGELIAIDLPPEDEESMNFFDDAMIDTGGITIVEDVKTVEKPSEVTTVVDVGGTLVEKMEQLC